MVGRALLRHALAAAGPRVEVTVLDGNPAALALYRREGFTITETRTGPLVGNEAFTVTGHIMHRDATPEHEDLGALRHRSARPSGGTVPAVTISTTAPPSAGDTVGRPGNASGPGVAAYGKAMSEQWSLTVDCAHPRDLAAFWCLALGYVPAPPPEGFATWEAWLVHFKIPEDEWDDGAFIEDPGGVRPGVSFLKVPEPKVVKNRMHFDIHVGGGREEPVEVRWPRVQAMVDKLVAAGGAVLRLDEPDGTPDHVTMTDPEGNEFDVL